ncbi:tripartite tricarboxylate transporter TctB family protein [Aquabacter spiritensis]|uniref:Putative tricarboxylic transport membrane protein n=1 Tax=Aquabacter spiritensis TaxID=933073 RepID=A0A4R3LSP5_9HYPH|nr:tripartite tricarboxylate transporter TctB family protein [Aquabacter spiritensis]TCT02569.1 putative tricarboxylic transport membrane protein [Aquabacter spiritensis]
MSFIRSPKDVLSGLLFLALAALFAWQASDLPMGSSVRMGPGYFPMVLSGIMALFGLIVLINGLRFDGDRTSAIAWRGVIMLTLATCFFGFFMRPLGFLPTLGVTVFLCTLASSKFRLMTALISVAVMVVFAWAVFIVGLGLPLQLVGPWLGGY